MVSDKSKNLSTESRRKLKSRRRRELLPSSLHQNLHDSEMLLTNRKFFFLVHRKLNADASLCAFQSIYTFSSHLLIASPDFLLDWLWAPQRSDLTDLHSTFTHSTACFSSLFTRETSNIGKN